MGFEGWMAQLLDGILGAGISAGVAAFVALTVVKRQHRADTAKTRLLAALEAAELLTQAIIDGSPGMHPRYQDADSNLGGPYIETSRRWARIYAIKWPALCTYIGPGKLDAYSKRLGEMALLANDLVGELDMSELDLDTGEHHGEPERQRRFLEAVLNVEEAGAGAATVLSDFRIDHAR
jgi:hypothetical protein